MYVACLFSVHETSTGHISPQNQNIYIFFLAIKFFWIVTNKSLISLMNYSSENDKIIT